MEESFESARPVGTARTLPHSIDAEQMLLAACLIDGPDVVSRCVMAGVRPQSFYDGKHRDTFAVVMDLYAGQKAIGVDTLAEELKTRRKFDELGGYAFLAQITSKAATTAEVNYFIEKVREGATLREVIATCTSAVENCYGFTGNLDELMTTISDRVTRAAGIGSLEAEETVQEVAKQILAEVMAPPEQRKASKPGISWGLIDVDAECGRLTPGSLIVLAGMPSTGKSALADLVAWHAAERNNETLIFTYEMTKRDYAVRIAQQLSRLNLEDFDKAPNDRRSEFTSALRAIINCKTLHLFERDVSVNRLVARVRAFAQRKKVGLIVVDFLQYLARLEPTIGRERTDEKIGRLTAALKGIAKECDCPVILLSSLNRDGYKEGNRPNLASLRSSGEIESDADVVAILHWPKENPVTKQPQDPHDSSQNFFYVEFNQEKGRSKGVHQVGLSFDRRCTRFDNYNP